MTGGMFYDVADLPASFRCLGSQGDVLFFRDARASVSSIKETFGVRIEAVCSVDDAKCEGVNLLLSYYSIGVKYRSHVTLFV